MFIMCEENVPGWRRRQYQILYHGISGVVEKESIGKELILLKGMFISLGGMCLYSQQFL